MNPELAKYQRAYQSALKQYCKSPGTSPRRQSTKLLGAKAVDSGLSPKETLNFHTHALLGLLDTETSEYSKKLLIGRASAFYGMFENAVDANLPEKSSTPGKLKRMVATLLTRSKELATSNKKLQHEVQQRKAGEKSQHASEKTTTQLLAKSLRMEDELRKLSRRMFVVQEEERKKISRELHDVIAQALAGINVHLAGLQTNGTAASKDLHQKISDTRRLVQQAVEIVHRCARELRPSALDDLGFIPALQSHIKNFRNQSKLRISLRAPADIEQIGMAEKIAFFRIVQESLFNVVQHAKATQVTVSITSTAEGFRLSIRDNGKGFSIPDPASIVGGGHLGLLGMRERIEMVGGTFHVESVRGKFTTIRALLPHSTSTPKAR